MNTVLRYARHLLGRNLHNDNACIGDSCCSTSGELGGCDCDKIDDGGGCDGDGGKVDGCDGWLDACKSDVLCTCGSWDVVGPVDDDDGGGVCGGCCVPFAFERCFCFLFATLQRVQSLEYTL
jgi:hypothetical protein